MFSKIGTWTQKKLLWTDRLLNILYFLLTFIAPIITVIVMFYSNGNIEYKYKAPLISLVVIIAIVFASTRFFKKQIHNMKILNIDGSYNDAARTTKHVLECLSSCIIPATLLATSCVLATVLKEWIEFYNLMIIICLSFYLGGIVVDKFLIGFMEDELSIRDQVAQANAIDSRKNSLK